MSSGLEVTLGRCNFEYKPFSTSAKTICISLCKALTGLWPVNDAL